MFGGFPLSTTPIASGGVADPSGGLVAEPVWEGATDSYTLSVEWFEVDDATGYRLALLDDADTQLEEIDTTGLTHAFEGLGAETTYQLVLTPYDEAGDLEPLETEITTPVGLPGGVENLQHTFTTDSLTFTWDAAKDADDYRLTLTRDGDLVEELTTSELEATFEELEDGTRYSLEIEARNAKGGGEPRAYSAETGFVTPATPTDLTELSTRIIAVEPGWELSEPDKIRQTRLQLLLGDQILYDEVEGEALTSRLFPVPMAGTDYFFRVKVGNPAGWSDWLEGTVSTLTYPLIDTRLGVLGATYQEDVLHPDTWDGGTDASGFGDPQSVAGGVELDFGLADLFGLLERDGVRPHVKVGDFSSRVVNKVYTDDWDNHDGIQPHVQVGDFSSRVVRKTYTDDRDNYDGIHPHIQVGDFSSVKKQFNYTDDRDNHDGIQPHVQVGDFSSVIP